MSSASAIRKAIRGLEDGLSLFTSQLAQETLELKRNVEQRPVTGATYYRNILEDLHDRLEGIAQELQALEGVCGVEAISLEELVGHSVALYCQNHQQIQQLEATLAKFGYRDLYAPLPPENPMDMLELVGVAGPSGPLEGPEDDAEYGNAAGKAAAEYGAAAPEGGDSGAAGEALCEVTNRLAAAQLAAGEASPSLQRAGMVGAGAGGPPRTTIKAMAPMTAAKALLARADADTPSSLSSPDAMSPSMRELLGKYAASSGGGTQHHLSAAPTAGSGTPRGALGSAARATPPVPAYLSPAFQLAAMEQEVQMVHAEAAAAQRGSGGGGTPEGATAGWQADDAMYNALTATAKKLADKPSFLEAYRQRFPHILASTERLLQTVEKQRRPAVAAAVAHEDAADGPVAALAMAAQQAASVQQQQQQEGRQDALMGMGMSRQLTDEESTLDLMSQLIRRAQPAAEEQTEDISQAAAAASSVQFQPTIAAAAAEEQEPPNTAALLSRARTFPGSSGAAASVSAASFDQQQQQHPISSLRADDGAGLAPSAARPQAQAAHGAAAPPTTAALLSAPPSERSKPQLEQAIAAALRRGTTAMPTPAAAVAPAGTGAGLAASQVCSAATTAAEGAAAPRPALMPAAPAPAPPAAAATAPVARPPAPPAAVPPSVSRPPPAPPAAPPPAPPAAATAPASAPIMVPALRPVDADEYATLPTFIKSQMPLDVLNSTLAAVHAAAQERSSGFTMEDVEAAGLGAKCKVVVNSLVKLGRAQLKVTLNHGTVYLLC